METHHRETLQASASQVGNGAERLVEAFQSWPLSPGRELTRQELTQWRSECGYALPPAWDLLVSRCPAFNLGGWQSHWHQPTPFGPGAPNAMLLITHGNGGRMGIELDPDDLGQRLAWWKLGSDLVRLASSWGELAQAIEKGPHGFLRFVSKPYAAAKETHWEALGFDPITRHWQNNAWEEGRRARLLTLESNGQGVALRGNWRRHPTQPIVALLEDRVSAP